MQVDIIPQTLIPAKFTTQYGSTKSLGCYQGREYLLDQDFL